MTSKNNFTLALMLPDVYGWYYDQLSKGVIEECRKLDLNLIIFVGSILHSPHQAESDKNIIYNLMRSRKIDGIISPSGTVISHLTKDEIDEYFKMFQPKPIVSISTEIENHPFIGIDNEIGMISIMNHLIEHHNYHDIVFVTGPEENDDSNIRLQAYKRSLIEHGIEFNPNYIIIGNFSWNCGKNVVKEIYDNRKLDIDVIVCGNDEMAFGIYSELADRGIRVPKDVALTGYDNLLPSGSTFPPLTTVSQPIKTQGVKAVSILLDILNGKETKQSIIIPTTAVIRDSCGCSNSSAQFSHKIIKTKKSSLKVENFKKSDIVSDYINSEKKEERKKKYIKLYDELAKEINGKKNSFNSKLKEYIYKKNISDESLTDWFNSIYFIFNHHIHNSQNKKHEKKLRNILLEAEDLRNTIRLQTYANKNLSNEIRYWSLNQVLERIGQCLNTKQLYDTLINEFRIMGVKCFYLSLYESEKNGLDINEAPTEKSRLYIGYENGELKEFKNGISFQTNKLVPWTEIKYNKNSIFHLHPISLRGLHFGFVMYEYEEEVSPNISPIYERICSSFYAIRQVKEIESTNQKLDKLNKTLEKKVNERTEELNKLNNDLTISDKAKTDFFANISHELRTPLTLLLSPLESLLEGDYGDSISDNKKRLNSIIKNGRRLLKLINNLLDFSKIESGKMKIKRVDTDVNLMLSDIIDSISSGAKTSGLQINFKGCDNSEIVYIDRDLIEKALFNLLSNSLKFTPEGGKIDVELFFDESNINIIVSDTGIGIPRKKIDSIFNRFEQVEEKPLRRVDGTGIGLAFTKEIIDLHNGSIKVESIENHGSRFILKIPIEHSRHKPTEIIQAKSNSSIFQDLGDLIPISDNYEINSDSKNEILLNDQKEYTILVVDDNEDMLNYISSILSSRYKIGTAYDGIEGLKRIKEIKPNLILSDLMMPKMDGLEFCQVIKEDIKINHIPVILLTAMADISNRVKGYKYKADDYISKPFHPKELIARIENLLEKSHLHSELKKSNFRLKSLDKLKNDFITNITHDFRSPLMVVMNTTSLSIKLNEGNEELQTSLSLIYNSSLKLKSTIDKLLDLAKMDAGGVQLYVTKVDMNSFIHEIISYFNPIANKMGIKLTFQSNVEKVKNFYTDRGKIEQIISNIISNSIKFVKKGMGEISVSITDQNERLKIEIADNGEGIEIEKIDSIFNRFEQSRAGIESGYKGTGIGLAFAKELTKYLKGKIKAYSEGKNRGSIFTLELPKGNRHFKDNDFEENDNSKSIRKEIKKIIEIELNEKDDRQGFFIHLNDYNKDSTEPKNIEQSVILVVDDEYPIRQIIYKTLTNAGYRNIILATNGLHGINAVYQYKPDLIICDYSMPVMNGATFHDELINNEVYNQIPFIFLSAIDDREIIQKRKLAGAIEYLKKPIVESELLGLIKINLEKYLDHQKRESIAYQDELTTIHNRRYLSITFNELITKGEINDVSIIFFDIDDFKNFNDKYGHPLGDKVLSKIGKILKKNFRGTDLPVRYGGEEFVILLPDTSIEGALSACQNLRKKINSEKVIFEGKRVNVTASFGITALKSNEEYISKKLGLSNITDVLKEKRNRKISRLSDNLLQLLIKMADSAMYEAKSTKCLDCNFSSLTTIDFDNGKCSKCLSDRIEVGKDQIMLFEEK